MTRREALAATVKTLHESMLRKRELLNARVDFDLELSRCDRQIAEATDELVRLVLRDGAEVDDCGHEALSAEANAVSAALRARVEQVGAQ